MLPPNRIHVIFESEGGRWTARVPEVDGCTATGFTVHLAEERIRKALEAALEDDTIGEQFIFHREIR